MASVQSLRIRGQSAELRGTWPECRLHGQYIAYGVGHRDQYAELIGYMTYVWPVCRAHGIHGQCAALMGYMASVQSSWGTWPEFVGHTAMQIGGNVGVHQPLGPEAEI